jgi:ankyrin repeat protein
MFLLAISTSVGASWLEGDANQEPQSRYQKMGNNINLYDARLMDDSTERNLGEKLPMPPISTLAKKAEKSKIDDIDVPQFDKQDFMLAEEKLSLEELVEEAADIEVDPDIRVEYEIDPIKQEEIEINMTHAELVDEKAIEEDIEGENIIDGLLEYNFTTEILPREYYERRNTKENAHLPATYFPSFYIKLAFEAASEEKIQQLRFFLDNYQFANIYDNRGNSLLIHSAAARSLDSARVLIANGADINFKNKQQKTALHAAVINNDFRMTRLLLSMGADPKLKDALGKTAATYAREGGRGKLLELIQEYI